MKVPETFPPFSKLRGFTAHTKIPLVCSDHLAPFITFNAAFVMNMAYLNPAESNELYRVQPILYCF
ncbi:hypothetical protein CSA37_08955 [Candidatus Fermentibacteria bacterium]|nr:MAG: hypothetical protein CSA37_08955 [Candidatus Fermentibacteria bacterium]